MDSRLHIKSPLISSAVLAEKCSFNVLLKLENTQPSGSFKLRGISYLCKKLQENGCRHFVSSSGGNAGLAVCHTARILGLPATIFVPSTTPGYIIEKMKSDGAVVHVKGSVWDEANQFATAFVQENPESGPALVHPFNHPDIWSGHSSLVEELFEDLSSPPSAIVLSVGGGGLLVGVLEGLHKVGWKDVPVVAVETRGADCFNAALKAGRLVTLPGITSVAKSLGALTVLQEALDWTAKHKIFSVLVDDKDAVDACLKFADDHRYLVEPACGAALATAYGDTLVTLQKEGLLTNISSVVIVVCGGSAVTTNDLILWKASQLS